MKIRVTLLAIGCLACASASAQSLPESFSPGPVIQGFGPSAPVEDAASIPQDMDFKVAFDIAEAGERGEVNRQFETVARFLNMHARAGVDRARIQPAIVVHGGAATHLLQPDAAEDATDTSLLVMALIDAGVPIYLCGQTAAARGISKDDLLPGVEMSLSAMTAHAQLSRAGYSLNPF